METALHQQQPIVATTPPGNATPGCIVRAGSAILASGEPLSAAVSDVCTRNRST
jgi:hypothetical protein